MARYFRDKEVSIPNKNTRIYSNGYVYYMTNSTYSKSGARCVEERVCIGKVTSSKMMMPNETYYFYFNKDALLQLPPKIDTYLHAGQYIAMNKVISSIGAYDALLKHFGSERTEKIIALALHINSNENCVGQDYDGWAFSNYSGLDISLSSGNISEIYKDILPEDVDSFLKLYKDNYKNIFKESSKLDCYAFDSTNQNTSSLNIEGAEFGKAKDPDNLRIINTAYMTDEDTGIPIYYEHFLGSLLDKTQINNSKLKLTELGYQELFFVFDRGYYAKEGICEMMKENQIAILAPESVSSTKNIIDKYINTIKNNEQYYLPRNNIYGIKIKSNSFLDRELNVYVYYDDDTAKLERDTMHGKLISLEARISAIRVLNEDVEKTYDSYFELTQGEGHILTKRKNDIIQSYLNRAGFFVVVSNKDLTLEQMIKVVKNKDCVEKNFRRMKSTFDASKTYCHSGITYEGKMFIVFIAILMSQGLCYYLEPYFKKMSSRTFRTTMNELNKLIIYKSKKNDAWLMKYALTKQIKEIFQLLNITEEDVEKYIEGIKL